MKKFLLLLAVAAMSASCIGDLSDQFGHGEGGKLPINISVAQSRANDVAFENGDQLGLYVVNHNASGAGTLKSYNNHVDNMRFTLSSTWTPDENIYWLDNSTKADFYAYYPYGTPANVNAYAFSVKNDQSSEADYWASDFLWGKRSSVSPTAEAVAIETEHLFSNALIYVVAGEGVSEESLAAADIEVKVCNVKTSATIDLATGDAVANGSSAEIKPWNTGSYYRAMIVPQVVSSNSKLLSVKINGEEYAHYTDIEFKRNTRHKITVTVTSADSPSSRFSVNFTIKEWQDDEVDYGGNLVKDEGKDTPDNKEFSVEFSEVTPQNATYVCTPVDSKMLYLLVSSQELGQYGVQGETPEELMKNYIQLLAINYMLTTQPDYYFVYQGASTEMPKYVSRWSAEESVTVYAVGFKATKTEEAYDMLIATEAELATPVNYWEVPFLPYPTLTVPENQLTHNVSSAAGELVIDCVLENPQTDGSEVMISSEATWATATWADNKLTIAYEANTAAVARRAKIAVQYGIYTDPFEITVNQEKDANAVAITLDVKVTGTTFNGIWVDVTPSDDTVTYALDSTAPDKNWETGAELPMDWATVAENLLSSVPGTTTFHKGAVKGHFIKMNPSNYEWYGLDYYVYAVAVDATSEEGTDYYGNPKTTWTVNGILSDVYYDRTTIDNSNMPSLEWDLTKNPDLVWNESAERYELEVVEGSTVKLYFNVTNPVAGASVKLNGTLYDSYNVVNGEPIIDNVEGSITLNIDTFDTSKKYHYISPYFKYTNEANDNWGITTPSLRITQVEASATRAIAGE